MRLAFAVDGLLAVAYATYVIADPTAMRELHCDTCDPATAEENNCSECTPAAVAETSANEALAWFVLGGALLGTAVLTTARVRRGVHSFLGSLGMEGEARNAAAVAALLGGATVADAVAQGKDNLRALPLDALTRDDLVGSADTGLNKKVVRAKFGDVDAFLSHSWHDSGSAKWAALQAWAEAFERAHGRRPTIWLDKACIDQQNIQASLAGLPVYLSGCDSMLVLIGKTYLSRLWCAAVCPRSPKVRPPHTHRPPCHRCVMELFVYLRMGGSRDKVIVKLLDTDGANLPQALSKFNAANARCYLDADRQKLLAVVESSFGTFQPFNKLVRQIMRQKLTESQKLNDLTAAIEQSVVRSQRDGSVRV